MKSKNKNAIVMLLTLAATAYASLNPQWGENSLLMWLFMAFVGLILVLQLIPGVVLFTCMIKGLFVEHAQEPELLFTGKGKK